MAGSFIWQFDNAIVDVEKITSAFVSFKKEKCRLAYDGKMIYFNVPNTTQNLTN